MAAKTYITSGTIVYTKNAVLDFYRRYLPADADLVEMLYGWKTAPDLRAELVGDFKGDQQRLFQRFADLMPPIEQAVAHVRELAL